MSEILIIGRKNGKPQTTQRLIASHFNVCESCKNELYCKENNDMMDLCLDTYLVCFNPKEKE